MVRRTCPRRYRDAPTRSRRGWPRSGARARPTCAFDAALGDDAQCDAARTTDLTLSPGDVLTGEFEARVALDELLDGDAQFQTGQVRSRTTVDPETEGQVPILEAVDHELVRVLEGRWVAIRRRKAQEDPVVLLHRGPVEVEVVVHQSRHRYRRIEAQELLDGQWHQFGFVDQSGQIVRVGGQMPDRGPDRRPRRVDTGDENEYH